MSNRCLVDVESTAVDIRRTRQQIALDPTDTCYLGTGRRDFLYKLEVTTFWLEVTFILYKNHVAYYLKTYDDKLLFLTLSR